MSNTTSAKHTAWTVNVTKTERKFLRAALHILRNAKAPAGRKVLECSINLIETDAAK